MSLDLHNFLKYLIFGLFSISAVPAKDYEQGATSILNAAGIGKLVPNMVLMGFKNDWMNDLDSIEGYLNVIHHGFNMHLAVGILKLKDGCDYSDVIGKLSFRCHSTSMSISISLIQSKNGEIV